MTALSTFQAAATTFAAAAATYAADATATASVKQGSVTYYFDPATDAFLGAGLSGASADNATTVLLAEIAAYAAANPEVLTFNAGGYRVVVNPAGVIVSLTAL